jgi:O-methyltransferase
MMVKATLKKVIKGSLKSLGLRSDGINEQTVPRWKYENILQKYRTLVMELHECVSEYVLPDLLPCSGRIDLIMNLIGTPVGASLYIVTYLQRVLNLDGDVCEFGVAQGATSALLANEIRPTKKTIWLFDSFKGLGKPSENDQLINDIFNLGSIDKYEGTMASRVEEVELRLNAISFPPSQVKIIAGFIEDTIQYAKLPEKVCFAYVDFDFYTPISTALRFLNERLVVGGVIVVDDYGFFSSGAKTAVDEFLKDYGYKYVTIVPSKFASQSTPFLILNRVA